MRYLEAHLIEKLKEKAPFSSIEAINEAAEHIIADINQRDFKNQRDIRKFRQHAFEAYDKPHRNGCAVRSGTGAPFDRNMQ